MGGITLARMNFEQESEMERLLINQLTTGNSASGYAQWEYRKDLNSENKLWDNFREILTDKNLSVLDGNPITDQEFEQIKNFISGFNTPYDAGKWLAGENGIYKIILTREDASLGRIPLIVGRRDAVAGGDTVYQVVHQVKRDKAIFEEQDRRFDVTLLINGLPMIQIELKSRRHGYMKAFYQIDKYMREGKYRGIFSTLQMFVISNGSESRYIASGHKMNSKFLIKWVDENNKPVTEYLEFAEDVLSIPAAHNMVLQYSVLDSDKKSVILLRPYQIHAIEAVREASKRQESGYIWHTTGSGKTLTSYKVARNLLQIPAIEKTIFVVDRTDLDQQTTEAFTSYAENDIIDVDETNNTNNLIDRLYSQDQTMIVTTKQKINTMLNRFETWRKADRNIKKIERIRKLKIAFVVDECHRAVSPQQKRKIETFFKSSLWYGFTGTPIFGENKKKTLGDLPATTKGQYGKELHNYTVKEAIDDKAVLGFQVEYKHTLSDETIDDIVKQATGKNPCDLESDEKEKLIPSSVYENQEHMIEVIKSIVNNSRKKLGFDNGVGQNYNAILTTSSIKQAQKYYELFKMLKNGELVDKDREIVQIDEKTKRVLPDFPKVAVTYTVSENEEDSSLNQDKMKESIKDYNAEFGTKWSIENIKAYNADITKRMARKEDYYQLRSNQLDIVIVRDRMLTGFDAPCLSTVFIDRPPQQLYDIIQTFSRTNRLYDRKKTYGQIVTFRTPSIYKKEVDAALLLYSNGGEDFVLAPTFEEAKEEFKKSIDKLRNLAAEPKDALSLKTKEEKKSFAKAFQELDKWFSSIQVYSEYNSEILSVEYQITEKEIVEYYGHYINILEDLKGNGDDEDNSVLDIEYELTSIRTDDVNYEYIISLMQSFIPLASEDISVNNVYSLLSKDDTIMSKVAEEEVFNYVAQPIKEKSREEIDKYINDLSVRNPKLGSVMMQLWFEIQMNASRFENKSVLSVLNDMIEQTIDDTIRKVSDKWFVGYEELKFYLENYREKRDKQVGETQLTNSQSYEAYKRNSSNPLPNKIKYNKKLREEIYPQILRDVILPLRNRR